MAGQKSQIGFHVLLKAFQRTHVQATCDAGTLQRLVGTVLFADGHQTGHLNLGELNLAAAKGSERL
jgi:prepilin-type processing-associated H-X9-DG protein